MRAPRLAATGLLLAAAPVSALLPINLAIRQALREQAAGTPEPGLQSADGPPALTLSVPVDHFHNESRYEPHSDASYDLRYWFDAAHYKPGGPVIVLHAGEFPSEGRLPFLAHGIVPILARAVGGLGVVLEHRYYGTSYPVTAPKSAADFRFLSTEQALADTAYFARHARFPGLEHANLTAPATPWIIYGGSYAGAFAALARKIYPDTFWGAISSSGVTAAIEDYWEYFEAHRLFSPAGCAEASQRVVRVVDDVLFEKDRSRVGDFKALFDLEDLADADFAETIAAGLYGMQSTNWDPDVDQYKYGHYCAAVSSEALLYASTAHLLPVARKYAKAAGFDEEDVEKVAHNLINFIGWNKSRIREEMTAMCGGQSAEQCFSRQGQLKSLNLDIGWIRSWMYQTCTEWGYFATGSGVPKDQDPMISRAIDLNYTSSHCPTLFNITTSPDVSRINKWGGFNFSYPRLAIVDGERDPWRAATPHRIDLPARNSSVTEPFLLVEYSVHHWDENGLYPDEWTEELPPPAVKEAKAFIREFVVEWLKEW
jgi:hypothetical protein